MQGVYNMPKTANVSCYFCLSALKLYDCEVMVMFLLSPPKLVNNEV